MEYVILQKPDDPDVLTVFEFEDSDTMDAVVKRVSYQLHKQRQKWFNIERCQLESMFAKKRRKQNEI